MIGECTTGVHIPKHIDDVCRDKVLFYFELMAKLKEHPVYSTPFRRELTKISDLGR